jgi:hypothetical protein
MAHDMIDGAKVIWIDLDNSPHVPFFRPIVDALRDRGCTVRISARDAFQVADLARLHGIDCRMIGRHFGKNKAMKALGLGVRAAQLLPFALQQRPHLAVSHGSRAQLLTARLLGIPSVVVADYEHVTHVTRPDWMIVPEVISKDVAGRQAKRVLTYPGIKEDVYACGFRPDPGIVAALGLSAHEVVVTVRPPATEAHYHNPDSETLFDEVIERLLGEPGTRIVLLPRNKRQERAFVERWPAALRDRKVIVPDRAVDGLNLVWHSDLVISGGGTMNREAAALRVPVYSIFRGTLGAVDLELARSGRLILLQSVADVRDKLVLAKRQRPGSFERSHHPALRTIVQEICAVASGEPAIGIAG